MLHLLVDTSTWLDLSKRRAGQRWIVALRVLAHQGEVELLVPRLVVDEFERNRERIETSMTASIAQRFKLIKQDLDDYGGTVQDQALKVVEDLARHVPLIGAMTTRNFDEVLELLRAGRAVEPTDEERRGVIERGLSKRAPFHRSRNSVADALLIELYAKAIRGVDLSQEPHAFVTTTARTSPYRMETAGSRIPTSLRSSLRTGRRTALGLRALTAFSWTISATTSGSCSTRQSLRRSLDDSARSWKQNRNCSTESGTTDLSSTSTGSAKPEIRPGWSG